MKLDLCKMFGVEEGQHFWIKIKYNKDWEYQIRDFEYQIKNNKIYNVGMFNDEEVANFDIYDIDEIYYKKPVELTENTKAFLKLIDKDYKWIARDEEGEVWVHKEKPEKSERHGIWGTLGLEKNHDIEEEFFDIDLSFIKWEDEEPTLISDLLGAKND